jgi:hypothetical protein
VPIADSAQALQCGEIKGLFVELLSLLDCWSFNLEPATALKLDVHTVP